MHSDHSAAVTVEQSVSPVSLSVGFMPLLTKLTPRQSFPGSSCQTTNNPTGTISEATNKKFGGNRYQCQYCDQQFSIERDYIFHVGNNHLTNIPWICKYCDSEFETEKGRQNHRKEKHGEVFRCSICQAILNSIDHLNDHVSFVHYRQKRNKCGDCGERFPWKNELNEHVCEGRSA